MTRKVYARDIYFYVVYLITLVIFIIGHIDVYGGVVSSIKPDNYYYGMYIIQIQIEQNPEMDQAQIDELIEKDR